MDLTEVIIVAGNVIYYPGRRFGIQRMKTTREVPKQSYKSGFSLVR